MRGEHAVIDRGVATTFMGFVLLNGVALLVSIPMPCRLEAYRAALIPLHAPVLFYVYALACGVLGARLGTLSAMRGERSFAVSRLVARIALANVASLPLLLYARALVPGRETGLVLCIMYGGVVALLWAVAGRWMGSGHGHRRPAVQWALKYGLLALYMFLPLLVVPIASPLGAAPRLLSEPTVGSALLAFLVPLGGLAVMTPLLWARMRGGRHV